MPKGVTRDVVEQIKIAGHLDAGEGEAAKSKSEGECHRTAACQ
jgi:hypothetical protein